MNKLGRITRDSNGFTLAEVLVYVALLTSLTSFIGVGFFHSMQTRQAVQTDGYAVHELRRGLGYFGDDVTMAREATVTADEVTLDWKDYYLNTNAVHTLTYELVGQDLVRTHVIDSVLNSQTIVARHVSSVTFSASGQSVTAVLTVQASDGGTKTLSVTGVMKPVLP